MAFQELLKVCVEHVEQKAFDGGVSHRGFPGCVDCSLHAVGLRPNFLNGSTWSGADGADLLT